MALPLRAFKAPVVTFPVVAELLVIVIVPAFPPAAFPVPALPPFAVMAPADVVKAPFDAMETVPALPPVWLAPLPLLPDAVSVPVVVTVWPESEIAPPDRPAVSGRAVPPLA
jgi:hypothetical protein